MTNSLHLHIHVPDRDSAAAEALRAILTRCLCAAVESPASTPSLRRVASLARISLNPTVEFPRRRRRPTNHLETRSLTIPSPR